MPLTRRGGRGGGLYRVPQGLYRLISLCNSVCGSGVGWTVELPQDTFDFLAPTHDMGDMWNAKFQGEQHNTSYHYHTEVPSAPPLSPLHIYITYMCEVKSRADTASNRKLTEFHSGGPMPPS